MPKELEPGTRWPTSMVPPILKSSPRKAGLIESSEGAARLPFFRLCGHSLSWRYQQMRKTMLCGSPQGSSLKLLQTSGRSIMVRPLTLALVLGLAAQVAMAVQIDSVLLPSAPVKAAEPRSLRLAEAVAVPPLA